MKRTILRGALATLALILTVYICDYCSLRFQIPGGRPQFGQVAVNTLYVIQQKNGKTEYQFGQPETDLCVHSLFPHFGSNPCWYATRHTERRVEI
jgi:hypothetical protein